MTHVNRTPSNAKDSGARRITCYYPGCSQLARLVNDGGFWCKHPHHGGGAA